MHRLPLLSPEQNGRSTGASAILDASRKGLRIENGFPDSDGPLERIQESGQEHLEGGAMTPNELLFGFRRASKGLGRNSGVRLRIWSWRIPQTKQNKIRRFRFISVSGLTLSGLAHVEFDAAECEDGWRVVPPALAIFQHDSWSHGRSLRRADSEARGQN